MPDLYIGMANQTARFLSMKENLLIPDVDSLTNFYRLLYNQTANSMDIKIASRSVEFYSYAIAGAPGGETLSPMIWAATKFPSFMAHMINAKSGFIIDGPAAVLFFADSIDNVYTANTTSLGLGVENIDTSSINNITTLDWDVIEHNMPKVDIASCYLNSLTDYNILDSIIKSINPNGMFLLSNASNGSELYHSANTFSEDVHNRILDTGEFFSFHIHGYISFTCFIKKG